MTSYHGASICTNGHVISKYDANKQNFCSHCGAPVISACRHCNRAICGLPDTDYAILGSRTYIRPDYCDNCGKPYPWTELAIQTATLLIQEEDELSEQLKEIAIQALPDIVTETPRTNLAVVRIKKVLVTAGKFTADGIRQFAIDFGCELAQRLLGLTP